VTAAWLPSGAPDAPKEQLLDYAKPVGVGDRTKIGMQVQSQRAGVKITSAASSASLPALSITTGPPCHGCLPRGEVVAMT